MSTLTHVPLPAFGQAEECPPLPAALYAGRLAAARARMAEDGLDALVVYGDREHFANLAYLTGFDPRFEEALLLLDRDGAGKLLVGNECMGYLPDAALGLDVELFVSAIGDQHLVYHAQRSYYEALLRAGVKIYLYRAPTVLHSKHFTIDDDVAVIGSSNMDVRSFSLNMEVSVMVQGESFVSAMRAIEDDYRASSDLLTLEEWMTRRLAGKVNDALARLTSSLQ